MWLVLIQFLEFAALIVFILAVAASAIVCLLLRLP